MKFRTEIEIKPIFGLAPEEKIVALGTCFAEKMGTILESQGLNILLNPFGVVYNPISLARQLTFSLSGSREEKFWEKLGDKYVNIFYHGVMSRGNLSEALANEKNSQEKLRQELAEAKLLILTFGTAFGYEDIACGEIVANCHRFPAERFQRRLLSQEEMFLAWQETLQNLRKLNPSLKIIFTVSPVRYIRDSLVENQLSKSMLRVLVHSLVALDKDFHYFPSYEIMIDDLRDYRFYEEDLVQPNGQALRYILEKFEIFCFSQDLKKYWQEAEEVKRLFGHRLTDGEANSAPFIMKREKKLEEFKKVYPWTRITTIIS